MTEINFFNLECQRVSGGLLQKGLKISSASVAQFSRELITNLQLAMVASSNKTLNETIVKQLFTSVTELNCRKNRDALLIFANICCFRGVNYSP